MTRIWAALALVALTLSGCGLGQSRLNPLNWFGGPEEVVADRTADVEVAVRDRDGRPLVAQVTALRIDRSGSGAIVTARGLPPTQGFHEVALVPEDDGEPVDGVLTYTFRAVPPPGATRVSTPVSREVVASATVSTAVLERTRTIRVQAAANALAARR